jgi:hypothetical protein
MDPVENAWRWLRWTAAGSESAISEAFRILHANLPKGWKRLTGDDLLRYGVMVEPGSGWYRFEATPPDAGIVLSIERPAPSLMAGGRAVVAKIARADRSEWRAGGMGRRGPIPR